MPSKSPQPDLEAIEERVNAVTNSAMSRAIAERDKLVQSYAQVNRTAESLGARLERLSTSINQAENAARSQEAKALQDLARFNRELERLRKVLAKVHESDEDEFAAMVGKQVTIVGGKQVMVAAGLDDDGDMICVYEADGQDVQLRIRSLAVPPRALVLLQQAAKKPAVKSARKAGSRA